MQSQHHRVLELRQLLSSFDHPLRDLAALEQQGEQTVPDNWVGALKDLGVAVAPGASTTEVTAAIWQKAGALALEYMG